MDGSKQCHWIVNVFVNLIADHHRTGIRAQQGFEIAVTADMEAEVRMLAAIGLPTFPRLRVNTDHLLDMAGKRGRNASAATTEIQPQSAVHVSTAVQFQGTQDRFRFAIAAFLAPAWVGW